MPSAARRRVESTEGEAGGGIRRSRGERTRHSILEAALRVIARGGVDAVTHRSVAAEAGLTHGTLTYHFDSREDIVLAAFRHYIAGFSAFVDALWDERAEDGWTIVDFSVELQKRQLLDREMLAAEYELILYASRNESLAREYKRWQGRVESRIAALLEERGAPRPHEAARIIVGITRAFELASLTDSRTKPTELGRQLERVLPALLDERARAPGAKRRKTR